MKLYTEEQLLKAIQLGRNYGGWVTTEPEILKQLIPIELPSDEKIDKIAEKTLGVSMNGFRLGAKWMKEQILGKEDKTFKQKSKWTEVDNMTRRLK